MCGRGRAGVRQERTAQYGGRMFVFATTQGFQGDMPSAMRQGSEKIPKVLTHRALRARGGARRSMGVKKRTNEHVF